MAHANKLRAVITANDLERSRQQTFSPTITSHSAR